MHYRCDLMQIGALLLVQLLVSLKCVSKFGAYAVQFQRAVWMNRWRQHRSAILGKVALRWLAKVGFCDIIRSLLVQEINTANFVTWQSSWIRIHFCRFPLSILAIWLGIQSIHWQFLWSISNRCLFICLRCQLSFRMTKIEFVRAMLIQLIM